MEVWVPTYLAVVGVSLAPCTLSENGGKFYDRHLELGV